MLSKNVILLLFALLSHVLTLNAQSDSINVVESVIKKDNYNLAEMSMSWAWSDQLSTYFTSCSDLYVIEYLYDLDLLEMKIDKEKDLNILDLACRCNKRKFLKKILKTEPVDVALYERGPTPMMILAKYGKRRLLRKRIKSSKSINKTGPLRKTALFYSVKRNDIKTTKLLLRKGADPSHLDLTNRTPIHYALLNDNVKLAKLLYSRCIDCDTLKGLW
jgi:ankyrin repeat protein